MKRRFPPFVYFIRRADGEGPIKIGCSGAPERRMGALQPWSPWDLCLLATIDGDEVLERRFHNHFREHHMRHEWFHPAPELIEAVAQVAAGQFDIAALPEPKVITSRAGKGWSEETRANFYAQRGLGLLEAAGVPIPKHLLAFNWYDLIGERRRFREAEIRAFVAKFPASMTTTAGVRRAQKLAEKSAQRDKAA